MNLFQTRPLLSEDVGVEGAPRRPPLEWLSRARLLCDRLAVIFLTVSSWSGFYTLGQFHRQDRKT